jgi:membrane protease subunit (stomatin/prohibitin family)
MRGRGLMLVGGMAMGRAAAQRDTEMQKQAYQQGQQTQQVQQSAQQPTPQKDTIAELQKLSDLHMQGVLTDEEFATAKKKLLT